MGKFKSSLLSESFVNLLDEKKRNFGRYQRGNKKHVNRTNNKIDKAEKGEKTNDFQQDTT